MGAVTQPPQAQQVRASTIPSKSLQEEAQLAPLEPPTEPEPTEPEPTGSESTEPEPTGSESTEPEPTGSEPTEPESTGSESTEPEPTEPELTLSKTSSSEQASSSSSAAPIEASGKTSFVQSSQRKDHWNRYSDIAQEICRLHDTGRMELGNWIANHNLRKVRNSDEQKAIQKKVFDEPEGYQMATVHQQSGSSNKSQLVSTEQANATKIGASKKTGWNANAANQAKLREQTEKSEKNIEWSRLFLDNVDLYLEENNLDITKFKSKDVEKAAEVLLQKGGIPTEFLNNLREDQGSDQIKQHIEGILSDDQNLSSWFANNIS